MQEKIAIKEQQVCLELTKDCDSYNIVQTCKSDRLSELYINCTMKSQGNHVHFSECEAMPKFEQLTIGEKTSLQSILHMSWSDYESTEPVKALESVKQITIINNPGFCEDLIKYIQGKYNEGSLKYAKQEINFQAVVTLERFQQPESAKQFQALEKYFSLIQIKHLLKHTLEERIRRLELIVYAQENRIQHLEKQLKEKQ